MRNETTSFKKTDKYNYGLDLLRLISMLSIVALHVVIAGGAYTKNDGFAGDVLWMIYHMFIVSSVNTFAMLSGYLYAGRREIKNRNIVKLLISTMFYYLVITFVFYFFSKEPLGTKTILKGVFPPVFGKNWYIVCYVFLFFCIPYLNMFIEKISQKSFGKLLVLLFVLLSIVPTFCIRDYFRTNSGYSPWWLIYCYMIGCYIKLYGMHEKIKSKSIVISLLTILMCVIYVCANKFILHSPIELDTTFLNRYTSPNIVFFAAMLIVLFEKIKIPNCMKKGIRILSAASFGVYIIHAHPLVMDKFFNNTFGFLGEYNAFIAILGVILVCLLVYLSCCAIDYARLLIFKLTGVEKLGDYIGQKLDNILNIE